jgi:hypothetical protein
MHARRYLKAARVVPHEALQEPAGGCGDALTCYKPIAELIDQLNRRRFREPIDRQNKDCVKPRFKGLRALTDGLNRDT